MDMTKIHNQLFKALHHRYTKQIKHLILNEGVLVNCPFPDGSYPLHIAAQKLDVETVKLLLSLSASPDYKNAHGETALMIAINNMVTAAQQSCLVIHIASALINKNCRVNLCDAQGRTALHLACLRRLPAVVRILTDAGAKVNCRDRCGRSPLHVTLLHLNHTSTESVSHAFQVIKILLSKHCEVNGKDQRNSTPLYLVVLAGDHCLDIARFLLDNGAHPDKISRHGVTPLMVASKRGHYQMAKLLIQFNCNVNVVCERTGKSCLFTACCAGYLVIAKVLLAAGAQLSQETWLWNFDQAAVEKLILSSNCQDVIDWLLEVSNSPLSLKELCRIAVRRSMKTSVEKDVNKLNYPQSLKKYLLLCDVFEETDEMFEVNKNKGDQKI